MSKKDAVVPGDDRVIRLRPYYYLHVLDNNNNITRVESGPKTFVRLDHEQIVLTPTPMVSIPPRSYCIIGNPHVRVDGAPVIEENGQVRLHHGEQEIRLDLEWKNPFPLYPGEFTQAAVTALTVVNPDTALRISAVRDFDDGDVHRVTGDEWLFIGPGTYIPRIECQVIEKILAQVVKPNQALKLKALRQFKDRRGVERKTGEEWLVREQGSYLPDVFEQVAGMVKARVLTEKRALHLTALHSFTDVYGVRRKAGQEWLVRHEDSQTHIADVHERVIGDMAITTLTKQQYCIVVNPISEDTNLPQWGKRELRLGELNFFLQPGERLENGIQDVEILGEEEALLLKAREKHSDEIEKKVRVPGEEWMIYGPQKYIPPVEVQIMERRRTIPLDANEGIYVRNKQTGKVYMVTGQTYMLKPKEELWNKQLPKVVEELLARVGYRGQDAQYEKPKARVPYKVVTYRVPHNAAVQIYDYKLKKSRVVFGPELVMLEPDEQFTVQSLSGGNPKRPNAITSLTLMLGPDFMNDVVVVETSDHARLKLMLSYNWNYEVDKEDPEKAAMIFSVRDFVGDTCKALASRVRGAVASRTFDDFHRNSSDIIREAVFGKDSNGEPAQQLVFSANLLAVTNVDVQSVEPVEQRTRDALQKSVQMAIEISTASQEALANHEAAREEQVAEGRLQRQKIKDQSEAEKERMTLVELKAETAISAAVGKAKAEAEARLEEALITANSAVNEATKKAQAQKIRSEARLAQLRMRQTQELEHKKALDALEIEKARKEAAIEVKKFKDIVDAIGPETIEAIARAGPEMQAKLLEGLGLQGFLVTDGTSPINLFNTANGLVGGGH